MQSEKLNGSVERVVIALRDMVHEAALEAVSPLQPLIKKLMTTLPSFAGKYPRCTTRSITV